MSSEMDFDKILKKCGDFNRYQFLLLGLFGFINFFASMHYFAQTIISFVPEHWCYHEKLVNKTFDEIRDIYSKYDNPSCTRLDDIIDDDGGNNAIVSELQCEKWIYNYDYGYRSMTTELNWVCDSAYKSSLGQSMFFIGSCFGTLLYGLLSDKFGRLPLLVVANLSALIGDVATIFSSDGVGFAVSRFVSGLAADFNIYLMYIIVLEYIRPSMRILCLNLGIGLFYCFGLTTTPWIAVLVGYWKYYLCCTSLPFIVVISYYFIISESAQWLVTNDDVDGAITRLRKIAKFNGKELTNSDIEKFRIYCEKQKFIFKENTEKKKNFFDLLRTPILRKRTLILFYLSIMTTLSYNCIARNVEGIGLSPFIIFSISSATLLPSGLILSFLQNQIGRKGMAFSSMSLCGAIMLIAGVYKSFKDGNSNETNIIVLSVLQVLARFSVSMTYESGTQYAADLIPTCVRGQGVAVMHVSGSAMSFLSVPLMLLENYYQALPSFILTIMLLLGAFVSLLLPETLHKILPQTLKEGEEFGRDDKFFEFACCKRKNSTDDLTNKTDNNEIENPRF